ncbi:SusC/RagA family TonB-linked outer membrane protein [Cytophagales bacterium LB-30]|uniref:SusC/RagA family TonB-linked outer membrane protein n=1 Tax=Shiella aurantiaca TaxID=3058365 RepID=A0ABT8F7M4_9BACT|nr:SusC/RagA family TonB-linked outer membrane protein [Shiella aurantiaca]MDN4165936.1 SusC/RagA family TonB-linked outer membrane protein [Shiella aurantiaca]
MKRILLLCFMGVFALFSVANAQERTVSGKVTSGADGSAIPGVNVMIKGTSTGTTTDIDGNFKLSVQDGAVLQFSSIGMKKKDVPVGSRSVMDITLEEDIAELSEVVVTAYGVERAANEITYQTEKVGAEEIMQGQQQIAAVGLAGKVAGLQINVQNNGVNPQAQILLRGFRSISANNEAMIVIDGAVATIGAFNNLNPNDIQSIDILKGANAGALYGSRAANGAVIVTTKQGKIGQRFIAGVNSSLTFEEVSFLPDFQTEHGIGWDGHYDPIENTNWGPRFDGQMRRVGPDFPDGYPVADQYIPYAPIKDNLRDFFNTGSTLQNNVYLSGGDETSTFFLSVGNTNTKGIVPDDEYSRRTVRVNASKKIGKVKLDLSSQYFEDESSVVGGSIGDQDRPLYWFILNTPANIPLSEYKDWQNPIGYGYADNYYNAYYQNPYWAIGTNRNNDWTNRLIANVNASYKITDKINFAVRTGINRRTGWGKNWRDAQTYNPDLQPSHADVSSFLTDSEFQDVEFNSNAILSLGTYEFGGDFSINGFLGAAVISSQYRASSITAVNLSIPGFYDISNGTGQLTAAVDQSQKRVYGFFGDVTVGFRKWAYLNLAGRQDYTSTLPLDNNSYFYPSTSLSVILSDAFPVITENPVLSFAKITVSNSTVYNDLGIYDLNERLTQPRFFPLGNTNGFEQSLVTVDPNIQKERLNTWELGLNTGLFNERFKLDVSVFNTITTDLITETTPSFASGSSTFLTNIGKLSSKGLEASFGGNVLKIGDFRWDLNANFTTYETVVKEIKDDLKEVALDDFGGYGTYAIVGMAFPQIKAQSYVRDPQGRVVINPANGNPEIGEVLPQGKTTPDYIIGLTSGFSFKGLSLSATMDYRTGHIYYSQGHDQMEFTGRSMESVSSDRKDFVFPNSSIRQSDGTFVANTNIPISGGRMGFWQNTFNEIKENYVRDATAFKIRELALNYSLPTSVLESTRVLSKVTVGIVARNLWVSLANQTNFSDPEFRNTGGANNDNGVGIGGYLQSPPTRSLGFNLNIEF